MSAAPPVLVHRPRPDDPLPRGLHPDALPRHVGVIMDGNGRWAKQRGLQRNAGHTRGETALFEVVEGGLALGLETMTFYAFSTENWRRPAAEVRFIMLFQRDLLRRRADELDERGVRVRFIGRREKPIPAGLIKLMDRTEQRTAHHTRMTLQIAFNYGGRAELADAARSLASDVAAGRVAPDEVDEASLGLRLYGPDVPDVDLLVRTSGELRLSNFLLWEAAYAELYFTETLWPDFDRESPYDAVAEYQRRGRRFGAV